MMSVLLTASRGSAGEWEAFGREWADVVPGARRVAVEWIGMMLGEGMRVDDSLELLSPRLRLRRLRREDAGGICAYRSRPEVARFQSWESFELADAARLIADQARVTPDTPGSWVQLAMT